MMDARLARFPREIVLAENTLALVSQLGYAEAGKAYFRENGELAIRLKERELTVTNWSGLGDERARTSPVEQLKIRE